MTRPSSTPISLPVPLDLEPMEAKLTETVPDDDGWMYEPKWDGFRCIAFRDGDRVALQSKSGKPLGRYFPDVVELLKGVGADRFVLDGELVVPVDTRLSFDELLLRIHPAESRVRTLAEAHPAMVIAFDLLAEGDEDLTELPYEERRNRLEHFADDNFADRRLRLSPATDDADRAKEWLSDNRIGLDGVIAKRIDLPYQSGNRNGMRKIKNYRSADCVVGGMRWSKDGGSVASLLLGLFGEDGDLHHVGFCSALNAKRKQEARERIEPLIGGEGFSGRAPKGESRWRSAEAAEWISLEPTLVVEVQYDHFNGGRFRHGTRFLRWRLDKDPAACTWDQLGDEGASATKML